MSILTWMEEKREAAKERERYLRDGPLPISPENSLFARKQLWVRCEMCGVILYISHLPQYHHTCKECGENIAMTPEERIASLIDTGSWRPMDELYSAADPLGFYDKKFYTERLAENQENTKSQDAIQTGTGLIDGIPVAFGVMTFEFMGGSMGCVVGEKVTRLIEYATVRGLMLVLVTASGGARMQEGTLSLMQMAKISGALYRHQVCARLNLITILTSPTTGGVTASFAMLGDVIIAEPKAVIGFAGRRVIEQTLRETLPDDFQTAEYLMDHGLVDLIIHRKYLRSTLIYLLNFNVAGHYRRAGSVYELVTYDVDPPSTPLVVNTDPFAVRSPSLPDPTAEGTVEGTAEGTVEGTAEGTVDEVRPAPRDAAADTAAGFEDAARMAASVIKEIKAQSAARRRREAEMELEATEPPTDPPSSDRDTDGHDKGSESSPTAS